MMLDIVLYTTTITGVGLWVRAHDKSCCYGYSNKNAILHPVYVINISQNNMTTTPPSSASRATSNSSISRGNNSHRVVNNVNNSDRPVQVQNSTRTRQQMKGAILL